MLNPRASHTSDVQVLREIVSNKFLLQNFTGTYTSFPPQPSQPQPSASAAFSASSATLAEALVALFSACSFRLEIMDYDLILERSRESTLRNWAANVHNEDVIRLASKYRPDHPQCIVECVLGGSFNICCKVVFTDGLQWIVRVPKPGRSMNMEEKVRGEVAAIKYIRLNTSIPVPDIIAFGSAEDNVGGFGPFMIMEFVVGDNLSVKLFDRNVNQDFEESIYRQIAGFLLQLSNCKFDAIGSLSMDSYRGEPTWSVRERPLTLAINEVLRGGGVNLYSKSSNKPPL